MICGGSSDQSRGGAKVVSSIPGFRVNVGTEDRQELRYWRTAMRRQGGCRAGFPGVAALLEGPIEHGKRNNPKEREAHGRGRRQLGWDDGCRRSNASYASRLSCGPQFRGQGTSPNLRLMALRTRSATGCGVVSTTTKRPPGGIKRSWSKVEAG
jgi:hypothetical protein